ncbi:MAG: TIM-barrel domain-containing protein [Candidatus Eisenbacteria bacterium]
MTPRISRWLQALLAPFALMGVLPARAGVGESIGDRMARFWPDSLSGQPAPASVILQRPFPALGPAPVGTRVVPEFASEQGGRVVRVRTERGTSLYGTGEVGGSLERTGKRVTCWNTDAYGYDSNTDALYQSHPWVLAVRADGSSYGVLADTPSRVVIDLSRGIEFRAQGPAFGVIVVERESPQAVVSALAELTGPMPLPPRWALGFQQCRYSYSTAREVESIASTFREHGLPCDVLWMDIDYMDQHRSFTFSESGFPEPRAMSTRLLAAGFRTVWILDPGIRREPGYFVYDQGEMGDHWVKGADGAPYVGKVWPGQCVFPDFTRRRTRAWWGRLTAELADQAGASGIWNDMNEPAVFEVTSKTMPETNRHDADTELGGPGPHLRYHNIYGLLMARATFEGVAASRPEKRPFVLSRANLLGGQRYAAAWTGDNHANEAHVRMAVPMVLNLGLSGQPFSGPDIGGFAEACTGEEYARWMGVGTLLPFSRAHAEKGNIRKEPWSFGPRIEALAKRSLQTRYRLLPYLYTLFEEAARTGLPVARPAFFAAPRDPTLRKVEHEFLLGRDLLVQLPWASPGLDAPSVSLGPTPWREAEVVPGEATPLLPTLRVRAGAIVPLGEAMAYSDAKPLAEIELLVSLDADGTAAGDLYEDAGDGHGNTRGEFRRTRFMAKREGNAVHITSTAEGAWTLPAGRFYRVTLLGTGSGVTVVGP